MDGWMDGMVDGWMDEWMDGWMDHRYYSLTEQDWKQLT